jgi:hypothetical protein
MGRVISFPPPPEVRRLRDEIDEVAADPHTKATAAHVAALRAEVERIERSLKRGRGN